METVAAESEAHGLLGELDALVSKLTTTDLTALSGEQLLDFTRDFERVTRRSVTVRHAVVAELDSRHAAAETGHHSTAALLSDLLRIDPGQASRRVRDAGEFGPRRGLGGEPLSPLMPQTTRALDAGEIGIEHARTISDLFDAIPGHDTDAEQAIEAAALHVAAACPPYRLRQWCVQAAARLDQDGTEPREQAQQRQRGLNVIDQPDGTAKLTGQLTPYAAATLRTILGPLSAPAPAEDGTRDERTASQRRHDGLADACTLLLLSDALPDSGGGSTTILVTIDYRGRRTPPPSQRRQDHPRRPQRFGRDHGLRPKQTPRLPGTTKSPRRPRWRMRPTRLHRPRRLVRNQSHPALATWRRHRHQQHGTRLPTRPRRPRPRRIHRHDQRSTALGRTHLPRPNPDAQT